MGRFMSPDFSDTPEAMPYADLSNPQSFNRYVYLNDNPLRGIDADGHCGAGDPPVFAGGGNSHIVERFIPCKETASQNLQSHWTNAKQDLKAAVNETTAKVTIGVGIGAKVSLKSLNLRAELADKDNATFSNGKLAISNTMEGGVSGGTDKQVGLAGSRTLEAASYDMKSGSFGGSQPAETEWTFGGRNGGTSAKASRSSMSLGEEAGEIVLYGGSISITPAGVQDLKKCLG